MADPISRRQIDAKLKAQQDATLPSAHRWLEADHEGGRLRRSPTELHQNLRQQLIKEQEDLFGEYPRTLSDLMRRLDFDESMKKLESANSKSRFAALSDEDNNSNKSIKCPPHAVCVHETARIFTDKDGTVVRMTEKRNTTNDGETTVTRQVVKRHKDGRVEEEEKTFVEKK